MGMMGMPMMGTPMMGTPMMGPMASMGPMGPMQRPMMPLSVSSAEVVVQKDVPVQEVTADQALAEQADLGQAAKMVEMLRNSGNPKFANSQFVNFIDKVSKGDLQFKENTVIDRDGNQVDWDALYDTEAAVATDAERQELDNLMRKGQGSSAWDDPALEDAWRAATGDGNLEKLWGEGGQAFDKKAMEDMWRLAQDGVQDEAEAALMERAFQEYHLDQYFSGHSAQKNRDYEFAKDNEFIGSHDPLAEALRLLRESRDREALLALEAEVQRNPESSEGWRLMGQLYADLDQDVEAIQCLRKGHEVDPYNLDSLLALGVSCTNELDQLPALRYLREWIENHEEHSVLVQGMEKPPEYEYEAWRQQVTALFNQAAQANPLDANVFVALGVMENINRNFDGAIAALATACRLRPNDYTCWNKLGATLANSGKSAQAVVAYHQGLQLKPNYARSWSNLAIAHANLGEHTDAARFYLSSLVLNPEATHIWAFLHSAVLNMKDLNSSQASLPEAIENRDLEAASRLIDGVLDPSDLPRPTQELPQPPDEILASIGL
jgi:peroxin-5